MLPILRIIPVGGVLLAIVILLMALTPPGGSRPVGPIAGARGPLIDRAEHPEWRQFLMLAALRRARELEQLRDLPDAPVVKTEPPPMAAPVAVEPPSPAPVAAEPAPEPDAKIAALPTTRDEAEPDVGVTDAPMPDAAVMPVEIGEASSTELPLKPPEPAVVPLPPAPPVIKIERRKPHEIRRRHIERRTRQARVQTKYDPNFNFFAALFGNYKYDASRNTRFGDQRYAAPQPSGAQ